MRIPIVIAVLAGAILAACGGGSSNAARSSTTAASGPTKAQFIAMADPICASGKRRAPTKRITTLISQLPTPTREIARLLRKTARVVRDVRDKLAALAPPPADRKAIARWIAENAAIGDLVSRAAGEVERGDLVAALKTQQDIAVASVDPFSFAKDYGLHSCSSIGS